VLLCVKCAKEGDRIPPLESYGQPLEQEHRLSCVLGDCGGASANFLDQFDGRLVLLLVLCCVLQICKRYVTRWSFDSTRVSTTSSRT